MSFPTKLLAPGEEVVLETRPNWSVLTRPTLFTLAIVAACVAVVLLWGSAPLAVGYVLIALCVLAGLRLTGKIVSWHSRLLVITTRRVIYRWGVVRRTGREIPLERVQDVTYHQTLLERIAGAGSLSIESAGTSGHEPFPDVRHPAEVQSLINQLLTADPESWKRPAEEAAPPRSGPHPQRASAPRWVPADRREREPATTELPPTAAPLGSYSSARADPAPPTVDPGAPSRAASADTPAGPLAEQLKDLERLHDAGVLTDLEFEAKRRELLDLG